VRLRVRAVSCLLSVAADGPAAAELQWCARLAGFVHLPVGQHLATCADNEQHGNLRLSWACYLACLAGPLPAVNVPDIVLGGLLLSTLASAAASVVLFRCDKELKNVQRSCQWSQIKCPSFESQ
jgi:hypothetical protein